MGSYTVYALSPSPSQRPAPTTTTTTTTTTTERLNSLCIKRHVLKGGINDFYRVKSEKKFQARQMLQEHLINQVQERFISKEDTRL